MTNHEAAQPTTHEITTNANYRTDALKFEKHIRDLYKSGVAVARQRFSTEAEAQAAISTVIDEWMGDDAGIDMAQHIPIECSGEGVIIPKIKVQKIEERNDAGLDIHVDPNDEYTRLDPFETVTGKIRAIGSNTEYDPQNEAFMSKVILHFIDTKERELYNLNSSNGMAMLHIVLTKEFSVECIPQSELIFPENEKFIAFEQSIANVAASGLTRSRFINEVHKLSATFHTKTNVFQSMKNVERLRWLARRCEDLSMGSVDPDDLRGVLIGIFGENRLMEVVGKAIDPAKDGELIGKQYQGKLVDILMKSDDETGVIPVMALESHDDEVSDKIALFPIKEVRAVSF